MVEAQARRILCREVLNAIIAITSSPGGKGRIHPIRDLRLTWARISGWLQVTLIGHMGCDARFLGLVPSAQSTPAPANDGAKKKSSKREWETTRSLSTMCRHCAPFKTKPKSAC